MFIAISATYKNKATIVVVVSNENTSLDVMSDMTKHGAKCARFYTDQSAFERYSYGENLEVDFCRDN